MGERNRRLGADRKINRRTIDRLNRTCAITLDAPKTTALVFEKIIAPMELIGDAPQDLVSNKSGKKLASLPTMSGGGLREAERQVQIKVRENEHHKTGENTPRFFLQAGSPRESLKWLLHHDPAGLCEQISDAGFRPVLCYSRIENDAETFKPGDYSFVVSCIRNLGIVNESDLSWGQVEDFRKDLESRCHLARFLHWLNEDMQGKSAAQIQDHLADLHEKQQRALHKFGIMTSAVAESLLAVGDKSLNSTLAATGSIAAGVGASIAADSPLWALLAGGLNLGGTIFLTARRACGRIGRENDAIAFIQQVEQLTPPQGMSSDDHWTFR